MGWFVHLLYVIKPFALCLCRLCGTRTAFSRHPAAYTHAHGKFVNAFHEPPTVRPQNSFRRNLLFSARTQPTGQSLMGTIRSINTALLFWRFGLFRFDLTRSQLTANTSSSRSCWIYSIRMSSCR
ncbi:GD19950 [Drosophila simulans]|uniref:GD19950 n=1 Tax=Drosophila simulans TaxID=7240 RepID=B4R0A0_DROSI|nr:GD19950 [Drosophila simulans]